MMHAGLPAEVRTNPQQEDHDLKHQNHDHDGIMIHVCYTSSLHAPSIMPSVDIHHIS